MREYDPTPELRKEKWLGELTDFLTESCQNGWASEAAKSVNPETGEKTVVYRRGQWAYIDTYSGYFAAPGESKVYFNGRHVWNMQYGGEGQKPQYFEEAEQTFSFLKEALAHHSPTMPIRGPHEYYSRHDTWCYRFKMISGTIENGVWLEEIDKKTEPKGNFQVYFSQVGTCGIIIGKDEDIQPVYPWNL